jgi:two-component system chemotaxis response regulator CheY
VAVVVVDIDHFKRINDTRGHAAGDQVIQDLASVLAASVRDGDVVVRLGGEEFLLLMTLTAAGDAVRLAEEVRARVEEQLRSVTVSIGVHEVVPDPDDPLPTALWRALDLADRALYEAKRSGRNRVVSAAS